VKQYRTIVADPPWPLMAGPKAFQTRKPTRAHGIDLNPRYAATTRPLAYATMTLDEIAALPVAHLASPDAHLYLWTVNRHLEATYDIARAWGFTPSTLLTWCKEPRGIGLGGTFTLASEWVLFCRRGSLKANQRIDRNWWQWRRPPRHSEKPEAFLDLVEQISPGPYVELFARRARFGWDYWGDESLGTAALDKARYVAEAGKRA